MTVAATFSPGELVRARGREWIVLSSGNELRLRPLTGSERLCCGSRVDVMGTGSRGPSGGARLALAGPRLRRLSALPHRSAQALALTSHRPSAVRPAAAIANHRVQDHQELAHAGGERKLRRTAGVGETLVKGTDRRVEADRGERGHEQDLAHAATATGDHTAPAEGT